MKLPLRILTVVVSVPCSLRSHSTSCKMPPPLSSITNGDLWLWTPWHLNLHHGELAVRWKNRSSKRLNSTWAGEVEFLNRNENLPVFSFCECLCFEWLCCPLSCKMFKPLPFLPLSPEQTATTPAPGLLHVGWVRALLGTEPPSAEARAPSWRDVAAPCV